MHCNGWSESTQKGKTLAIYSMAIVDNKNQRPFHYWSKSFLPLVRSRAELGGSYVQWVWHCWYTWVPSSKLIGSVFSQLGQEGINNVSAPSLSDWEDLIKKGYYRICFDTWLRYTRSSWWPFGFGRLQVILQATWCNWAATLNFQESRNLHNIPNSLQGSRSFMPLPISFLSKRSIWDSYDFHNLRVPHHPCLHRKSSLLSRDKAVLFPRTSL